MDTLIKPEIIEVSIEKTIREVDTVYIVEKTVEDTTNISNILDSVKTDNFIEAVNANEKIVKDQKVGEVLLKIIDFKEDVEEDTLRTKLLDVKILKQENITVQFWKSPLNYLGYKLSRSILVVYGLLPSDDMMFYKSGNIYYLSVNKVYYKLEETNDYRDYLNVDKPEFIHD